MYGDSLSYTAFWKDPSTTFILNDTLPTSDYFFNYFHQPPLIRKRLDKSRTRINNHRKLTSTLNRACKVSNMSFRSADGQAGSDNSHAMISFNSSNDSCGFCIQIRAFTTIARTYTHSHATVVRTTSISEANRLAIVSTPPGPFDSGVAFRVAARSKIDSENYGPGSRTSIADGIRYFPSTRSKVED